MRPSPKALVFGLVLRSISTGHLGVEWFVNRNGIGVGREFLHCWYDFCTGWLMRLIRLMMGREEEGRGEAGFEVVRSLDFCLQGRLWRRGRGQGTRRDISLIG